MVYCQNCGHELPEGSNFCPNCGASLKTLQIGETIRMPDIIAEFHYWDYGEYSKDAMKPRPEIKTEDLEKIAKEFNVKISVKRGSAAYFTSMRIGYRKTFYGKIVIQVTGKHLEDVNKCVGRIFLRYGKPDEIPPAFFGEKKKGKRIIEDLLKEYEERKR